MVIFKVSRYKNLNTPFKHLGSLEFVNLQRQSPGGVLQTNVLKNFAKFTGKHQCQSLFTNKVAG